MEMGKIMTIIVHICVWNLIPIDFWDFYLDV